MDLVQLKVFFHLKFLHVKLILNFEILIFIANYKSNFNVHSMFLFKCFQEYLIFQFYDPDLEDYLLLLLISQLFSNLLLDLIINFHFYCF